jgi:hypothetical protein
MIKSDIACLSEENQARLSFLKRKQAMSAANSDLIHFQGAIGIMK